MRVSVCNVDWCARRFFTFSISFTLSTFKATSFPFTLASHFNSIYMRTGAYSKHNNNNVWLGKMSECVEKCETHGTGTFLFNQTKPNQSEPIQIESNRIHTLNRISLFIYLFSSIFNHYIESFITSASRSCMW